MLLVLSLPLELLLEASRQMLTDSSFCGAPEAGLANRRRFDCEGALDFNEVLIGAANCFELAEAEPCSRMPISDTTSGSPEAASPSNNASDASSSESGLQRCTGRSSEKIGFCRVIAAAAAAL